MAGMSERAVVCKAVESDNFFSQDMKFITRVELSISPLAMLHPLSVSLG